MIHDEAERTPWWRSRWVRGALSLAVVVLIFGFFFPMVADYGEVWTTITAMTTLELVTLGAAAVWDIVCHWPLQTAVQPGLRLREAAVTNLASTAVSNTLPGGGALGMGVTLTMQRSWGIPVAETALGMVVSGVSSNFVKIGVLPVVALFLLVLSGDAGPALVAAALVGLAVLAAAIGLFALLLRSEQMAARLGAAAGRAVSAVRRVVRQGPVTGWDEGAVTFRADVVGLLERRWIRITVATLVSQLSLYFVLLIALRHVGVSNDEVSWQAVLAGLAFVRLVSAVPITPSGLGFVELGLTAVLGSGLPDGTKVQVATAVLLYRGLTRLLPVPLGVGCWVFWRANTSWRRTLDQRQAWRQFTGESTEAPPADVLR